MSGSDPTPAPPCRRALLVDDSPALRRQLSGLLERYGFHSEHAENGASALRSLGTSKFDLIFLDMEMPVMDGPTALRAIRARGYPGPLVLTTSVTDTERLKSVIKLGASDYLRKPFAQDDVEAVLGRLQMVDPPIEDGSIDDGSIDEDESLRPRA